MGEGVFTGYAELSIGGSTPETGWPVQVDGNLKRDRDVVRNAGWTQLVAVAAQRQSERDRPARRSIDSPDPARIHPVLVRLLPQESNGALGVVQALWQCGPAILLCAQALSANIR